MVERIVERILVGIDFSEASRAALAQGAQWARGLGIPLKAMHVLSSPPVLLPEGFPAVLAALDTKDVESRAMARLREWTAPYPHAVPEVRWGAPAQCLVEAAGPGTPLMIGQDGTPRLQRLFFGSTAERVVRLAACDVLVIREGRTAPSGSPASLAKETP